MNYDVMRRQREFGVRLALGATGSRLVATVLRGGAAWVTPIESAATTIVRAVSWIESARGQPTHGLRLAFTVSSIHC